MTNKLAPFPLMWVLPLAVYLLTYVVAFGRSSDMIYRVAGRLFPYVSLLAMPLQSKQLFIRVAPARPEQPLQQRA